MAYILPKDWKFPNKNYAKMKTMPYEVKETLSMMRIQEWYEKYGGEVYVSFSGGLDSTVLAYIVCKTYRKYELNNTVHLVFSDTGVEFPEIRQFVKEYAKWLQDEFTDLKIDLEILKPSKGNSFKEICEKYGFPIISKYTALKIYKLRNGNLSEKYRNYLMNGDERGKFGMLPKKWRFLLNKQVIKFDLSEKCCHLLKKKPFYIYKKKTGRLPFYGITQDEGFDRENQYNKTGCNVYDAKDPKSQPIAFWRKQDVFQYVVENEIPICSVYGEIKLSSQGIYYNTGEERTGCVTCAFGCHLEQEPNRIQRLSISHPFMYNAAMKCTNNGVTYKEALEQVGIPTETWESVGQMNVMELLK